MVAANRCWIDYIGLGQLALIALALSACGGGGGGGGVGDRDAPEAAANRRFVDQNVRNPGDGRTWRRAFRTLGEGLAVIAADPDLDELWVASGTYQPDEADGISSSIVLPAGITLYGGFASGQSDPAERTLTGEVLERSLLDGGIGGGTPEERVRHVVIGAEGATLDGFTITAGWARDGDWTSMGGGGLLIDGVAMTVRNCRFEGCRAEEDGGGLLAIDATLSLMSCWFEGNEASKGAGIQAVRSVVSAIDCDFVDNIADPVAGLGGGAAGYESDYLIDRCRFVGNSAGEHGGGLWIDRGDVFVTASRFSQNASRWGGGTSIYLSSGAFASCVFNGNFAQTIADYSGAGAFNSNGNAGITVAGCTFVGNHATQTDGIGGTVICNTTDDVFSGCIFVDSQSDILGDTARLVNGTISFTACRIESPLTDSEEFYGYVHGFVDLGGNLVGADPGFADAGAVVGDDGIFGTDDDGLHLLSTSTLAGAGDPATLEALATDPDRAAALATDTAGAPRFSGETTSMGAYETLVPAGDG